MEIEILNGILTDTVSNLFSPGFTFDLGPPTNISMYSNFNNFSK